MPDELANSRAVDITIFLDGLRAAARDRRQLILAPEHVDILLSDEVYTLLSKIEAESLRTTVQSKSMRHIARRASRPTRSTVRPNKAPQCAIRGPATDRATPRKHLASRF